MKPLAGVFVCISLVATLSLGSDDHSMNTTATSNSQIDSDPLTAINLNYLRSVKPIFKAKCFDCHSEQTRWPWYHAIPGLKQLIDHDVNEGREHLDLTGDFPFGGHGSPEEDLDAIGESLEKNEMPPMKYRFMHWNSKLTESEKIEVLKWVNTSRKILKDIMGEGIQVETGHEAHHD